MDEVDAANIPIRRPGRLMTLGALAEKELHRTVVVWEPRSRATQTWSYGEFCSDVRRAAVVPPARVVVADGGTGGLDWAGTGERER
jgi:hypothetical protein